MDPNQCSSIHVTPLAFSFFSKHYPASTGPVTACAWPGLFMHWRYRVQLQWVMATYLHCMQLGMFWQGSCLFNAYLGPAAVLAGVCFQDDEAVVLLLTGHPRCHLGAVERDLQAVAYLRKEHLHGCPCQCKARSFRVCQRLLQDPTQPAPPVHAADSSGWPPLVVTAAVHASSQHRTVSLWIRLCNHTYIHTYIQDRDSDHEHLERNFEHFCIKAGHFHGKCGHGSPMQRRKPPYLRTAPADRGLVRCSAGVPAGTIAIVTISPMRCVAF